MNRLFQVFISLAIALGVALSPAPVSAAVDSIGGVTIIPGSGSDLTAIRLRTSAGCPAGADSYNARMKGHGFPADGEVVTSTISAGMSHSSGFDVYFAVTLADFAQLNHAALRGRYDITVSCIDGLTQKSYGEFTGSLQFTTPSHYEAIGTAKPAGAPPPPLPMDGGRVASGATSTPPAMATPPHRVPDGEQTAPSTSAPLPGAQPVTTISNDGARQSFPWPVLVVIVLAGFIVIAAVVIRTQKRHSS